MEEDVTTMMNLNIEIPDDLAAVVTAQARAKGLSPDRFVSGILKDTLCAQIEAGVTKPLKTGRGMLAQYGTAPSAEDMDQNRREMFDKFGQDF